MYAIIAIVLILIGIVILTLATKGYKSTAKKVLPITLIIVGLLSVVTGLILLLK